MSTVTTTIAPPVISHGYVSPEDRKRDSGADTVTTTISYIVPPADGSRLISHAYVDPETGKRESNYKTEPYEVQVENIRGKEHLYSLDKNGFGIFNAPAKHKSFRSDEEVEREYYPEVIEHIKKFTGASRVVIFDHTIRRRNPESKGDDPAQRQPVLLAHVDQSFNASTARVHRHLPVEDAPELLKKRFQIINLWRPIDHPALDHPLAVSDWNSLDAENDVIPATLRYKDRDGETLAVKYNPQHKWKYVRGLTPDEFILIKCSESIRDGSVAQLTAHTAFNDPTTPADAPRRESIEVRTLVFYD